MMRMVMFNLMFNTSVDSSMRKMKNIQRWTKLLKKIWTYLTLSNSKTCRWLMRTEIWWIWTFHRDIFTCSESKNLSIQQHARPKKEAFSGNWSLWEGRLGHRGKLDLSSYENSGLSWIIRWDRLQGKDQESSGMSASRSSRNYVCLLLQEKNLLRLPQPWQSLEDSGVRRLMAFV